MNNHLDLAAIASLVGDPARLRMLAALLVVGQLSASELAAVAGVSPQTASAHLGKLRQGGLIARAHGFYGARQRIFRLTDDDVTRAVASLLVLATAEPPVKPVTGEQDAQVCYGHLGGALGHMLFETLLSQAMLEPVVAPFGSSYRVTEHGAVRLGAFGIDIVALRKQRRHFANRCLNIPEANAHLSGSLAEALLKELLERRWVLRQDGDKPVVQLTEAGRDGMAETFGMHL